MLASRHLILMVSTACSLLAWASSVGHDLHSDSGMQACALERDDAKRLHCYDNEVRVKNAGPTDLPKPQPTTDAAALVQEFGYSDVLARADRQSEAVNELEQLTATITQVSKRTHGELTITLDNGQVWQEKTVSPLSRTLKKEDRITIKRGALGSFYLVGNSKRSTQVSRVR